MIPVHLFAGFLSSSLDFHFCTEPMHGNATAANFTSNTFCSILDFFTLLHAHYVVLRRARLLLQIHCIFGCCALGSKMKIQRVDDGKSSIQWILAYRTGLKLKGQIAFISEPEFVVAIIPSWMGSATKIQNPLI